MRRVSLAYTSTTVNRMRFPKGKSIDTRDLDSLAPAFKRGESRCGVYRLRFANGEAYCGQATNVIRRYGAHRRHYPDIVGVDFFPFSKARNDGGIDGVIDQDALGLSRIYVQAKRYAPDHPVSRPEVQTFVGALHGAQANQGVFLTTSSYSPGAVAYADSVPTRVVLINGPLLTQLMIKHGVGVQVKRTIHLVEIDKDFFE